MPALLRHHEPMSRKNHYIVVVLLFAVYLINGLIAIPRLSITSDEGDHLLYGIRVLQLHPEKVRPFEDASTMPISALNALPRAVEQVTASEKLVKTDGGVSDIFSGRYITLLVCLLVGLFIHKWSKELAGENAALFSLFLFVFCPNLNANNYLLTTDSYSALLTLLTGYYFYRFLQHSGWKDFILFSAFIGISQATKQSLILLFFFFGVLSLVILIKRGSLFSRFRINLGRLLALTGIVLLMINIAFLFNGTGRPLDAYHFSSNFFIRMKAWPLISHLPMPLPVPFLEGFDQVKYMLSLGSGHEETSARSYLFGSYFTGKGVWYYYPCVILFKTPLSIWVSLCLLGVQMIRKKIKDTNGTGYPLLLAFFFVAMVMLLNTSQHSIRHLLMIYPLIYVSLGSLAASSFRGKKYYFGVIVLYSISTFYYYFPNLVSYTNELLWNKTNVYKTIASSNIDYGQCSLFAEEYLRRNPGVQWAPLQPAAGKFIIGINNYLDLRGSGEYAWLRNFKPEQQVDHCYLFFNVTEEALKAKGLK